MPARLASNATVFLTAAALLCGTACERAAEIAPAAVVEVERYPSDISPPPGTAYPCALTALPKDLPGIPSGDRAYINRTYARILRATQAKLVALKALEDNKSIGAAVARYDAAVAKIGETLAHDKPPAGLESFHANVIAAIGLQRTFFNKGGSQRIGGDSMQQIYAIPEGRQASSRLITAWGQMSARYPSWSEATKDSIYHHLCALDLF
jgi:hypothetical protein